MTAGDRVWRATARRQFDQLAERWHRQGEPPDERLRWVLDQLGCAPGGAILDAGCGTGNWTMPFARQGYRALGVDLSPAMIAGARRAAEARGLATRAAFVVGAIEHLPVAAAAFDAVLCLHVLDFSPRPGHALVEFARILRPGGRLVLGVLGVYSPVKREWWRRFLPSADPEVPHTANDILPWEMGALLRELGWRIAGEYPLFAPNATRAANSENAPAGDYPTDPILRQTIAAGWQFVAERP